MNVIKKLILVIKKIFNKHKYIEVTRETNNNINNIINDQKKKFEDSLKATSIPKKKIKTLICEGDGTGIQSKLIS